MSACTCPTCGATVDAGDFHIDEDRGLITYRGATVYLTPKQMLLVKALWDAYPRVLRRDDLLAAIGSDDGGTRPRLIDVMVSKLRDPMAMIGAGFETSNGVGIALRLTDDAKDARERYRAQRGGKSTSVTPEQRLLIAALRERRTPEQEIARQLRITYRALAEAMPTERAKRGQVAA